MMAARLEVRLGPEHRRMLEEISAARGAPISHVVRELIDQAYDDFWREERLLAAKRIGEMEIEDVPDPDELSRQLDSTYDTPLP